jgi:hypothetical protein
MKEHPILFNSEMVRAVLAGKKTQTRRVVKPKPLWVYDNKVPVKTEDADPKGAIKCPYGQPGDRLWVRETHRAMIRGSECAPGWVPQIEFRADRKCFDLPPICISEWQKMKTDGNWRPSIFMPRWASRINLEITGVRVERVQDIGPMDALSEGCRIDWNIENCPENQFRNLWDSINANRKDKDGNILPYSWDDNPWVWVVEFRRERT